MSLFGKKPSSDPNAFSYTGLTDSYNGFGNSEFNELAFISRIESIIEDNKLEKEPNFRRTAMTLDKKLKANPDPQVRFFAFIVLAKEMIISDKSGKESLRTVKACLDGGGVSSLKSAMMRNTTNYTLMDQHAIRQWGPDSFTDPAELVDYKKKQSYMSASPTPYTFRFIIHAISRSHFEYSRELRDNPIATMSNWDAISMSVVAGGMVSSYGPIGYVLKVPAQNVMVTGASDLMFRNHIGNDSMAHHELNRRASPASDAAKHVKMGMLSRHIAKKGVDRILTPDELMDRTFGGDRNEIIVAGRPGVNIYPNLPATRPLQLQAGFIIVPEVSQSYEIHKPEEYATPKMIAMMRATCMKLHVPLLYLPGEFNS